MSDKNLYQYELMDLAKNPKNYGPIENPDFCTKQQNISCGDMVTLFGTVDTNQLKKLTFQGSGCVLSMAMASKLTERVIGLSLQEVLLLDERLVGELLGMELGINRLQCGLLSIVALQQGVSEYIKNFSDASKFE